MRLEIHVRPNSSSTIVGGSHGGALIVRVREAPESGRATEAALAAVAKALSIPRRTVTLVRGGTARRKVIDVAGGDGDTRLRARLDELLGEA